MSQPTQTYELLRERLRGQARTLADRATALNQSRLELFGSTAFEVAGTARVRTDNNAVPRDVAQVGDLLLFGFNVTLGLRSELGVADVLALYRPIRGEGTFELEAVPPDGTFLDDPRFVADFEEIPGEIQALFDRETIGRTIVRLWK